eukprot:1827828-Rhodomonas_salina.1
MECNGAEYRVPQRHGFGGQTSVSDAVSAAAQKDLAKAKEAAAKMAQRALVTRELRVLRCVDERERGLAWVSTLTLGGALSLIHI